MKIYLKEGVVLSAKKVRRKFAIHCARKRGITALEFKEMSELYDKLCAEADVAIRKHNPCEIINGKCLAGSPCCSFCEFFSKTKGCKVRSLACKLWLCNKAREKFKLCARKLDILKDIAKENRFIPLGERSIKDDVFCHYCIVNQ